MDPNKTIFHALDRNADIEESQRNLPHWFQVGAAMFITFRTADSIPREVLERMQNELVSWLANKKLPVELAYSTTGKKLPNHEQLLGALSAPERKQFKKLASTLFHTALDECHGKCHLRNGSLADFVAQSILHCQGEAFDLDCFVIMPNHVHVIVQFRTQGGRAIVGQGWMRYSARQINASIGERGAFWKPEAFDHIIRNSEQFIYLRNYVANNPIKAGLSPGEYLLWGIPK